MGLVPGKNIIAKILAIIMAALLWLYVMNEQNPPIEASFTVPLEVKNLGSSYIVLDAPDAVRVKVRGSRSIVAGVQAQDIQSYVDVKGLSEGRHTVKVYTNIPPSLELVEVNPDKVQFRIDTGASRQVGVEVKLTGTTLPDTAAGKTVIRPDQVTVEGPKTLLDLVDKAVVVIDMTGRSTADITADMPVIAIGRDGKEVQGVSIFPDKVNVALSFVQGTNRKIVDVKTMVIGDLSSGVLLRRVTTEPTKIQIQGAPDTLQRIDFVYTEPINLAGINKDTTRDAKLQFPPGVTGSQSTVTVLISVGATR